MLLAQLLNADTPAAGFGRVVGILQPDDFDRPINRLIFETVQAIALSGGIVTPAAVSLELDRSGNLAVLLGEPDPALDAITPRKLQAFDRLTRLADTCPTALGIEGTARQLKTVAYNRAMYRLLYDRAQDILDRPDLRLPATLTADILDAVTRLDPGGQAEQPRWLFESSDEDEAEFDAFLNNPAAIQGYQTGLRDLDTRLGGWQRGKLTLIAARTSVGKTIVGLRIAQGIAERGTAVYYASMEMPLKAIKQRLVWARSGVSPETLKQQEAGATSAQREMIERARSWCEGLRLLVDDRTGSEWPVLLAHMEQAVARDEVRVCVIDHVDLVRYAKQERLNRHSQLATIMAGLQAFAVKRNVCMVVLSQVNRGAANRENGIPSLEDLRESGSKEEDADDVLLLSRPATGKDWATLEPEIRHRFTVDIAKHRSGATGRVQLWVDPPVYRLEDRAPEWRQ